MTSSDKCEGFLLFTAITLTITTSDDWAEVQGDVYIPLDLENTPLEIKTDSKLGSGDDVYVSFHTTRGERAGGLEISFYSTRYWLDYCNSWTNFPSNLPSEVEKIWRITLDKTAGIRLQIHCNGVEVLNVLMSDNTCSYSDWRYYWSKDVENIYFHPSHDTASDYYRTGQTGTWLSSMTICFPLHSIFSYCSYPPK